MHSGLVRPGQSTGATVFVTNKWGMIRDLSPYQALDRTNRRLTEAVHSPIDPSNFPTDTGGHARPCCLGERCPSIKPLVAPKDEAGNSRTTIPHKMWNGYRGLNPFVF